MSQTRTFDESIADAADLYVREYGSVEAAIEALAERRKTDRLGGRVEEAIACLRYRGSEDEH